MNKNTIFLMKIVLKFGAVFNIEPKFLIKIKFLFCI